MVAEQHSEKPISIEETGISQKVEQLIEVPHIDFILGDKLFTIEDCDLLVQSKQLMHLMVKSHIHVEVKHQKQQYVPSTSKWHTVSKYEKSEPSLHVMHKTQGSIGKSEVHTADL